VKETQLGGVQGQSRGTARIVQNLAIESVDVNLLPANGMSGFCKMNPNLMGTSRLQSARYDGITGQVFDDVHVSDGLFPSMGVASATPASIASVAHQP
jgi:hypothetical protein